MDITTIPFVCTDLGLNSTVIVEICKLKKINNTLHNIFSMYIRSPSHN